jgi:hypothetical protein
MPQGPGSGQAWMTMKDLILAAQAGGMDLTAELLSCGCIDLLIECFFAVKKAGAENCNGIVMWYAHKQHSASDGYAMLCYHVSLVSTH